MHDLVINNATVYDGTGAAPRVASVAVNGDRVVDIGSDLGRAAEIVDGAGLALAPGFIDTHTHYDAQITWDPLANPSPTLGVTTVIMGNCGFTIAPCRPEHRDLTLRNLTHVEGMSLSALREGVQWSFETFPEYLDFLTQRGVGANVAAYVGHCSVRTWVMGEAATERAATAEEIEEMAILVRDGLAAGGIGFSTSTFEGHNGEGGVPMPSRLANDAELRALVGVLGQASHGVFMLTKGSMTPVPYLEALIADTGRPALVAALLHDSTRPDAAIADLNHIGEASARGHEMYGQVSCCPLTMDFTLEAPYLMESLDAWAPAMGAQGDALKAVYQNREFRAAVKREIEVPGRLRVFNGQWDRIKVVEAADPRNRAAEGQSIAALAAADGQHPLDWWLDFGLTEDLKTQFAALLLNSDESAVRRLLRHPQASVALSDAGAHLTFFCDAGYALHLLGHWARDKGQFPMETAIHMLTGRQADIYRLPDRGRIAVGAHADLVLFDPETIGRSSNRRIHDLPGGAPRLTCSATGLDGVWVNGQRIVNDGALVDSPPRAGEVIRTFAA